MEPKKDHYEINPDEIHPDNPAPPEKIHITQAFRALREHLEKVEEERFDVEQEWAEVRARIEAMEEGAKSHDTRNSEEDPETKSELNLDIRSGGPDAEVIPFGTGGSRWKRWEPLLDPSLPGVALSALFAVMVSVLSVIFIGLSNASHILPLSLGFSLAYSWHRALRGSYRVFHQSPRARKQAREDARLFSGLHLISDPVKVRVGEARTVPKVRRGMRRSHDAPPGLSTVGLKQQFIALYGPVSAVVAGFVYVVAV